MMTSNKRDEKGRFTKGRRESLEELEKRRQKMICHNVTNETRKKIGDANRGKKRGTMTLKMKKKLSMAQREAHRKDSSIGKRSGKSRLGVPRKNWASAKTVQAYCKKHGIDSRSKWRRHWKTHKRPDNFPSEPEVTYKMSSGEFFDTGVIATFKRKYIPFEKAREFAHKLKLKSQPGWFKYCKSGEKPDNIPTTPDRHYKNKGWISWGDFLGTGIIATFKKKWMSFEKARKFARTLELTNRDQWKQYCYSDKRPDDIPISPNTAYKKKWKGWGNWLGNYKNKKGGWWQFEKSKKYIQKFKLKNREEFKKLHKQGKLSNDIPANPAETYKKEWKGWGDFLGTGTLSPTEIGKQYLSWIEAQPIYRRLARENGLKNGTDWKRFAKENKKLLQKLQIPQDPWRFYSKERILRSMKNG